MPSSVPWLDLIIRRGERLAIVGASGAANQPCFTSWEPWKTSRGACCTAARHFLWEEKPLAQFRNRQIGFVFQFHYLLPESMRWKRNDAWDHRRHFPARIERSALFLLERLDLT